MALHGLAGQAVEVEPYRTYELGPFEVSFTPSVHSKLLLRLAVPYDGELTCEHLDALSPGAYRCGQVWGTVVPTHYDNFFRPLGQRLEFVANVQLAELPGEIGAVSRDIELAALPRSDSNAPT